MQAAHSIAYQLEMYLARPYATELIRNDDGTYFARIVEFDGCMTEGDTKAEALANLEDATRLWLTVRIEDGLAIPEPASVAGYNGKFLVRLPKSMHRDLARRAVEEGVSINQLALAGIARSLGDNTPFGTRNIAISPKAWDELVNGSTAPADQYGGPSRSAGSRVWTRLGNRYALGYRIAGSNVVIWTQIDGPAPDHVAPSGDEVEIRKELAESLFD